MSRPIFGAVATGEPPNWATVRDTSTPTTTREESVAQQYFPDGVTPAALYRPGDQGDEKTITERLAEIDRVLGRRR